MIDGQLQARMVIVTRRWLALMICLLGLALPRLALNAQAASQPSAAAPLPPPPPATKLEAFKPAAGSVVTFGYTELGNLSGISVDVRQITDLRGSTARGLLVDVRESQYRRERSFVDEDELPDLLRGLDALLEVKTNPTNFEQFEVRYTTKGELRITSFNDANGRMRYSIEAGRTLKASSFVGESELRRFRELVETGRQRLAAIAR